MEILKTKHQIMQQALFRLNEGIQEISTGHHVTELMRDGLTQRFEYCIDNFWKYLKLYLETEQGKKVEKVGPRIILLLALDTQHINKAEYDILIDAIADRNLTSHIYEEKTARQILEHTPLYYKTMKAILDRLNPNLV